jgi:hypothetical protein
VVKRVLRLAILTIWRLYEGCEETEVAGSGLRAGVRPDAPMKV